MKKLLLLPIFASIASSLFFTKGLDLDLHHLLGRCSGSNAYCSACSNCSACKNCAVYGGSCAVCYTPKVTKSARTPRRIKSRSSGSSRNSIYYSSKKSSRVPQPSGVSRVPSASAIGNQNEIPNHSRELNQRDDAEVAQRNTLQVPAQFLTPLPKTNRKYSVEIPDDAEIIMVIVSKANLRELATTKSAIIEEIPYGNLLIKLGGSGDWIKVQTIDSGTVGFVFSELVQ